MAHNFPTGTQGQRYWFSYDALGSVVGSTKMSGQSDHNYRYGDYGLIEPQTGNFTSPHNEFTYTGQQWDQNVGVYEFYSRAYDPITGTWLQQDHYRGEIQDPMSLHRYMYVNDSPTSYGDLYGYFIGEGFLQDTYAKAYDYLDPLNETDIKNTYYSELIWTEELKNNSVKIEDKNIKLVQDTDLLVDGVGTDPRLVFCSSDHSGDKQIDRIIMHMTDNNSFLWTKANWESNSGLSAHYVIDKDGTIYHLVPDNYSAQHAGGGNLYYANSRSIGIEVVGKPSDGYTFAQKKSALALTKSLAGQYEIKSNQVVSHADISDHRTDGKECIDAIRNNIDGKDGGSCNTITYKPSLKEQINYKVNEFENSILRMYYPSIF